MSNFKDWEVEVVRKVNQLLEKQKLVENVEDKISWNKNLKKIFSVKSCFEGICTIE